MIRKFFENHSELNPKFWDGDELKTKIRDGCLAVVDAFQDYIGYQLPIVDIVFCGSNAGYNYTDKSDIDIHIVINFEQISKDKKLVAMLCDGWKTSFNHKYDIDFVGCEVEVYVEDMQSSTHSNGIYSIKRDKWLKHPRQIDIPDIDIEDTLEEVKLECEDAYNSDNPDTIQDFINELYYQRKLGLQTDGEFSMGNLIFKALRNDGLLQQLKDRLAELKSKELSVEQLRFGKQKCSCAY